MFMYLLSLSSILFVGGLLAALNSHENSLCYNYHLISLQKRCSSSLVSSEIFPL